MKPPLERAQPAYAVSEPTIGPMEQVIAAHVAIMATG